MSEVFFIDRKTGREEREEIYGRAFLKLLYSDHLLCRLFSFLFLPLVAKCAFLSHLYGAFQRSPLSRKKIRPFIQKFGVDESEFLEPVSSFRSFNDFFIRKLKPSTRPIASGAILPADGRYLVFPDIHRSDGFHVKGKKFTLEDLIQDHRLSHRYEHGSLVMARLAPVDYHRFHFPVDATPEPPRLIRGDLYSVSPLALRKRIERLCENKRMLTILHAKEFGTVLYIEVGASFVGAIHQTFTPGVLCKKGDEKGYFSFGGSCILLLFEPGRIDFDSDLLEASMQRKEVKANFGDSLGRALSR